MSEHPRIYVACLAAYNSGTLHGEWIDLDGTTDIGDRIAEVLETSPIEDAEEWAVHDHEYCGCLSEYPGMDTLRSIEEAYTNADNNGICWEVFIEYCDHTGRDLSIDHVTEFQTSYAGSAETLVEWCDNHLHETGQLDCIPVNLRYYFNFEAFARDMEVSDVLTIERSNEVLVFWQH